MEKMKITNVRATQPDAPGTPSDWRGWMGQIAVAVDTDDGLTGHGIGGGGTAGIHVIETALRPLLLGADATDVEGLWETMYRATLPYGRKGLAIMAISGVDLALWDLRSKAADKPVAALLSHAPRADVPAYRTGGAEDALTSRWPTDLGPSRSAASGVSIRPATPMRSWRCCAGRAPRWVRMWR